MFGILGNVQFIKYQRIHTAYWSDVVLLTHRVLGIVLLLRLIPLRNSEMYTLIDRSIELTMNSKAVNHKHFVVNLYCNLLLNVTNCIDYGYQWPYVLR